jgi:hypothetical protein
MASNDCLDLLRSHNCRSIGIDIQFVVAAKQTTQSLIGHILTAGYEPAALTNTLPQKVAGVLRNLIQDRVCILRLCILLSGIVIVVVLIVFDLLIHTTIQVGALAAAAWAGLVKVVKKLLGKPLIDAAEVEAVFA